MCESATTPAALYIESAPTGVFVQHTPTTPFLLNFDPGPSAQIGIHAVDNEPTPVDTPMEVRVQSEDAYGNATVGRSDEVRHPRLTRDDL